ncbi:MAG: PrsW family glutamic-type intramembrane protease [Rhodanobacteraceae bacterium]
MFAPIGLLPVVVFLLFLVYLDSYRMVHPRLVVATIIAGGAAAVVAYWVNGQLLDLLGMDLTHYSRWVAPVVEESLKALVMVWLFRSNRVGFLVDSAILGFAVGAGFALVENLYYLYLSIDTSLMIWLVRGFGTALMHGGVVAIFAVMAQTMSSRSLRIRWWHYLPGWLLAIAVHSIFNHFFVSPVASAVGTLLILPPILYLIFRISEHRTHQWLETDFDEDSELIRIIDSDHFGQSPVGIFLGQLKDTFDGIVVADMLCYLRLYTELALRAKGLLLMRESGLDVPMDAETRGKFAELDYLEKSIGTTGCFMMRPFLQMTRKDLWQLYVLKE